MAKNLQFSTADFVDSSIEHSNAHGQLALHASKISLERRSDHHHHHNDPYHILKEASATDVTASTQADDAAHTGTSDNGAHHLCDDAFAFPGHATSTNGSASDSVSELVSNAHNTDSWSGLGSEISAFVHELQDYVGEHHLTSPEAHKLVEAIHAQIASSFDFHV